MYSRLIPKKAMAPPSAEHRDALARLMAFSKYVTLLTHGKVRAHYWIEVAVHALYAERRIG